MVGIGNARRKKNILAKALIRRICTCVRTEQKIHIDLLEMELSTVVLSLSFQFHSWAYFVF